MSRIFTIPRETDSLMLPLIAAGGAMLVTIIVLFLISRVPSNFRRPIVVITTFMAGFLWVVDWLIPRAEITAADGVTTSTAAPMPFYPGDYSAVTGVISQFSQILSGILLALGVLSILRVHVRRVTKAEKDSFFSGVLLVSMFTMIVVGLWDWIDKNRQAAQMIPADPETNMNVAFNVIFLDMLQILDAAMFSLIAFFILSAAYRAFRIRSIEATIMMAVALIVLMGFIPLTIMITSGLPAEGFLSNFRIENVKDWLLLKVNTPALRAIDLGLALGLLAMAVRIMLGLERGVTVD